MFRLSSGSKEDQESHLFKASEGVGCDGLGRNLQEQKDYSSDRRRVFDSLHYTAMLGNVYQSFFEGITRMGLYYNIMEPCPSLDTLKSTSFMKA